MDAYGNLQAQLQQIQNLMNRQPVQPQLPQKTVTTIPEVDGLEGARTFLKSMAPSSSAAVFDKNEAVFYGLAVDANGNAAPIRKCPFTVEEVPEPGADTITKADFDKFKEEIRAVLAGLAQEEDAE